MGAPISREAFEALRRMHDATGLPFRPESFEVEDADGRPAAQPEELEGRVSAAVARMREQL